MTVDRRGVRGVLALVALLLVTAGCGGQQGDTAPSGNEAGGEGAAGEVLRIGVLTPLTGPQTQVGEDLRAGVEFFVEQNPEVAGRPLELVIEDDASDPRRGLTAARKLVEQDGVEAVVGIVNSAVLDAVQEVVLGAEVPLIVTNAGTNAYTQAPVDPFAFRVSHTNGQNNRALGWYAYDELGYRRVAVLTYDFIAGAEQAGAFMETFTSLGGEVVSEQKAPLGTPDFASYISNVPDDVDALYVFLAGADAVRFFQQADSFGLTDAVPMIGPGFTLDDIVLQAVGEAALGFTGAIQYLSTVETPANEEFAEAYRDSVGRVPTVYAADAYTGMAALGAAVEELGGDTGDPQRFAETLGGVEFEAPRGPFRFDENHQAVFTAYVYETDTEGGTPANTVIDEIPDVDQDWSPPS